MKELAISDQAHAAKAWSMLNLRRMWNNAKAAKRVCLKLAMFARVGVGEEAVQRADRRFR